MRTLATVAAIFFSMAFPQTGHALILHIEEVYRSCADHQKVPPHRQARCNELASQIEASTRRGFQNPVGKGPGGFAVFDLGEGNALSIQMIREFPVMESHCIIGYNGSACDGLIRK